MKTFLLLVALVSASYLSVLGQQKITLKPQRLAIDKEPARTAATARPQSHNPARMASLTDWTIIDSMGNIYGMASHELNPFAYDPDLNILTFVHRGDVTSYSSSSGWLYYSYSTDAGNAWNRSVSLNGTPDDTIGARFPSGSIFSPTASINDAWFFSSFAQLYAPSTLGDAGVSGDFPILTNNVFNRTIHHDSLIEFGSTQTTWSSDSAMFFASTIIDYNTGDYPGTAFFSSKTWSPDSTNYVIPPGLDTSHCVDNSSHLGGDAIRVGSLEKICYGAIGYFYRYKDPANVANIVTPECFGVVYSTNEGSTWTGWNGAGVIDTVITENIPELGAYKYIWRWQNFSNKVGGDICLDALGYPHIVTGVQTNSSGVGVNVAIAEIYRDVTGWHGKIISPANASTNYAINGLDQNGYSPFISRNNEGTVFACQYNNSYWPDGNSDIFVSARTLNAQNWNSPINITNTPNEPGNTFSEVLSHFSNMMRHDSANSYTVWSAYADPMDHTDPAASPMRTYIQFRAVHLHFNSTLPSPSTIYWLSPKVGSTITEESTFTNFMIRLQYHTDSFPLDSLDFKMRILDGGGSELFTSLVRTPPPPVGGPLSGSVFVTFPGSFIPPYTGWYRFEATVKIFYDEVYGDTSIVFVNVIIPAPITRSQVRKVYSPYTEITGGTPGPTGDDADMRFALPFQFMYDNVVYDSLNISTNGWLQFGKAGFRPDSLPYGLSHPMVSGAGNDNAIGFDTRPPLHVASPWWEDMNTNISGDPAAGVSYRVDGTAPNRILTIQWKSMLVWFDSTFVNSRISFQAKLFETSNMLEFVYGTVSAGTFFYGDGASISLKDATGGAYHYFDVYERRSGQPSDGNILLNPLVNWPGHDSAYQILANVVCSPIIYNGRWNLTSLPFIRSDASLHSVHPTAIYQSGYDSTHYVNNDTIFVPGKGYWTRFPSAGTHEVCGAPLPTIDVNVLAGWNLIGSVDHVVTAPSGGSIASSVFGFSNGYYVASTLEPGRGYWVKTHAAGTLTLGPTAEPKQTTENIGSFNNITFTDHSGQSQKLFFTEDCSESIDLNRYEMPPPPPAGIFDARFASQRILESFIKNGTHEFPILLSSAEYPITVSADIKSPSLEASLNFNGKKIRLGANSSVQISNLQSHITLIIAGGREVPTTFALHQNYPNPFNPLTNINYQLPIHNWVSLRVYDVLGREIATLVNEVKEPGEYAVNWDASGFASGIYCYRLQAGGFIETKKLVLLK